MSVMSAAEAGQPSGARPEVSARGPRMAQSVNGPDGVQEDAGSPGGCPARAVPPPRAGDDRRLRLVTTEVHVTQVRVARAVSTRTVRAGGPEMGVPRASVRRAGVRLASVRLASAGRVSVRRASAGRVSVRGAVARPGGLRLTRRGRRVLTGLVMLVIVISAMLIWTGVAGGAQPPASGSPARSPYKGMTQIVVRPGQTLWSVADAAEPSADPWTVIQEISDVNALNGTQIQAGQLLWVPRG